MISRFLLRAALTGFSVVAALGLTSCDALLASCRERDGASEAESSASLAAEMPAGVLQDQLVEALSSVEPASVPSSLAGVRVHTSITPHVEFLLTTERRLKITLLDEEDNVSSLPDQPITAMIIDAPDSSELAFVMNGRVLTSEAALPGNDDCRLAIRYRGLSDSVDVLPPLSEWKPVADSPSLHLQK